jgi:hypothetical protein
MTPLHRRPLAAVLGTVLALAAAVRASPREPDPLEVDLAAADAVVVGRVAKILGGRPNWRFRIEVERVIAPASLKAASLDASVFGGAEAAGYPGNSQRVVLFLCKPEMRDLGLHRLTLDYDYASAPAAIRDAVTDQRRAAANALAARLVCSATNDAPTKRRIALAAFRALRTEVDDRDLHDTFTQAARKAIPARDEASVKAVLLLAEDADPSWPRHVRETLVEGRASVLDRFLTRATEAARKTQVTFGPILEDEAVRHRLLELLEAPNTTDATLHFLEATAAAAETTPPPESRDALRTKWKKRLLAAPR